MRKIFALLVMCLLASAAWADDITFVAGTDNGDSPGTAQAFTIEKCGIKIAVSNGLANDTQYRIYKNQTMTVTSTVGDIIKIELECTASGEAQYGPGCFVTSIGDYTYEGKLGVWTGSSQSILFTAVTNQVRITKIIVTVDDGTVSAPIINPASGTYYEPFVATISCYDPKAVIHYTTDGSDPDVQSMVYTEPILVDCDMTIKAVSELDGEMSDVVSANYHLIENIGQYGCFADLNLLPEGTPVRFTSPIYALAQRGNYLYAKDACGGCAMIWGNVGQTYSLGDVIPEGFVVTKSIYSGEMELKEPNNFRQAMGNISINPDTITAAQLGHDRFAHYVWIHKVKIDTDRRALIDEDGNEIPYYNSLNATIPVALDRWYDVHGIIGSYAPQNSDVVYQLLPVRFTPCDDDYEGVGLGNYWKYIDFVNPPESITFGLDATVILQTGNYLYAKDKTGYGLIYGSVGQTYKHGDVIPAGYGGKPILYQSLPELTQPLHGFQPAKDNEDVVPEEVSIPQININHYAHYVIIRQVIIDKEKGVIRDQYGNELHIYIRPGLPFTYPDDLPQSTDICGIITFYRNEPQLLVWDLNVIPVPVDCLQEYYNNPEYEGKLIKLKLKVIYQNGASLYVQDMCGDYTLVYGNVGGSYVNGDIIEGNVRITTYQQHQQLSSEGDWIKVGHGDPVEPEDAGCTEEVSQDMCHWYVRFENVQFVTEDGYTYIEDECGEMLLLYNRFQITIPEPGVVPSASDPYDLNHDGEVNLADLNCLIDIILSGTIDYGWPAADGAIDQEMAYDVTGFVAVYREELELYPISIVPCGPNCVIMGDLNNDSEVNIADVNALIDHITSRR